MTPISSVKKFRDFGLLVGITFPLLFGFIFPFLTKHEFRYWTLAIGIILCTLSFISPKTLRYPYHLWIKFGNLLGSINSRIILSIIFIFIMQPIAAIMKLLRYDPLKRRLNKSNSYREIRKDDRIDLDKIF
ncbi:SxtJ family membrane protein [Prochlorococcus sp. MIT 0604]|uniref:SxtJ family membrane protein n=1 Tax=Prochlorococcus sp. MIT 0604 TaxID=1501268 RepID=UPI0005B54C7A|nr:SxtJ family membrane protein [Prochlorococcus sp. MIT 0604]